MTTENQPSAPSSIGVHPCPIRGNTSARCENLEPRRHYSVSLTNHTLSIAGTSAADSIALATTATGLLRVSVNGVVRRVPTSAIRRVSVDAGGGNDLVTFSQTAAGFRRPVTLVGGAGNDTLNGAAGDDLLLGGAGDDVLVGNAGDDRLRGNAGRDALAGGRGDDDLAGDAGVDTVAGGAGLDAFHDTDAASEVVDRAAGEQTIADRPVAPAWAAVNDFTYQLQNADLAAIGRTKFDLAVIDTADNDGVPWTKSQIADLRNSPGGTKRVLAYVSIGEAEDYRAYWKPAWDADHDGTPDAGAPAWLAAQNPDWAGNYTVRYWDPAWQKITLARINAAVAQGFDGVYLDIVDAFETWGPDGNNQRPAAEQDMVDLVKAIAAEARRASGNPNFAVVPQNGEALGTHADYVAAVTAIGHEDVFYDGDTPNDAGTVGDLITALDRFKAAGKPVFVVDYPQRPANVDRVYAAAAAHGYVAYCPTRDLDRLTINAGHEPD